MKRSANSDLVPRRQKASRKKHDSSDPLHQDSGSWNADRIQTLIVRARGHCDAYNRFVLYAQNGVKVSSSDAPCQQGAKVSKVLQRLGDFIQSTEKGLEAIFSELERELSEFARVGAKLLGAYLGEDLLSLPLQELKRCLPHLGNSDPKHLASCLFEQLSSAAQGLPVYEEDGLGKHAKSIDDAIAAVGAGSDNSEYDDLNTRSDECSDYDRVTVFDEETRKYVYSDEETRYVFLRKVFACVQELIRIGCFKDAFHALVLLKTLHHSKTSRIEGVNLIPAHREIDKAIDELVESTELATKLFGVGGRSGKLPVHGDSDLVTMYYWTCPPLALSCLYWDFASAARALSGAYEKRDCTSLDLKYCLRKGCFHQLSYGRLDWLRRKAWSEIRANVFTTIGTLVSAELTEKIFECALDLEDLPIDPTIVEPRNFDKRTTEVYVEIKEGFKCRRMKAIDGNEAVGWISGENSSSESGTDSGSLDDSSGENYR